MFQWQKRSISLLFILFPFFIIAQKSDSVKAVTPAEKKVIAEALPAAVDSTVLYSSSAQDYMLDHSGSSKHEDTTLKDIQNYYRIGVLGNVGLPSYSLLAEPDKRVSNTLFRWNKLNNNNDLITESDPIYFSTPKIYTRISAAMGQKQEQYLKLVHAQKLFKKVNIGLLFNRYSCLGFYQNQQSLTTNLLFSSNYKTASGRWGYGFYYLFNKLKYQLNGGIKNDSLFNNDNVLAEKSLFAVNLATAKQNIKTSSLNFNTFFRFNRSDSNKVAHYFVYETNYQSNYWVYSDASTDFGFYKNDFIFTTASKDSVSSKTFSNSLLYRLNVLGDKVIFYGGYKSEISRYTQAVIDTFMTNNILKSGLQLRFKNHRFTANAQYVFNGYNLANYLGDAAYTVRFARNFQLRAAANVSNQLPEYFLMRFIGNHFMWNNHFSPVQTQDASITLNSPKYKFYLGAYIGQQQNQIYFDTAAMPQQYNKGTMISRFYAGKDLKLGWLHFNNYLNYQATPNTDIIRLPQFVTSHQLYYEGRLFKKNLWLQVGVQARYISSYMANAYQPATNQFYLQDKKEYGNYIFADVFINAEIKPVKFFLMASHINQGLSGANYMLTPNYPMPDRSLKAGLVWMLFD